MLTESFLATRFGCSVAQVRAMHAKNADTLRGMLAKAESTGRKVNGYTAEQLRGAVADAEILAQGGRP